MAKVSFMANGKRVTFTTKSKKSRGSKKSGSKSRKPTRARSRKSNKPRRSSTRSVAKKGSKRRGGSKKSFIDRIPVLRNKTVQRVGFGLGMGVLVVKAIDFVAQVAPPSVAGPLQQNKKIIKLATEFLTEPISGIVDLVTDPSTLQQITGRFGGGGGTSSTQQQAGGNMSGFA